MHGEHDADHAVEAGGDVDHRQADAHRAGFRAAVDAVVASHSADDRVIAREAAERAFGAEARDLAVNEARELLRQLLVADAPLLHGARLEVLDQHVGAFEQPQEDRAPLGLCEVETDRALVAVDPNEVGGVLVMEGRAPVTHLVALRRLKLDDVGAMVGQQLRRERASQHAREVDHLDAGEGAGAAGGGHGMFLRGVPRPIAAS